MEGKEWWPNHVNGGLGLLEGSAHSRLPWRGSRGVRQDHRTAWQECCRCPKQDTEILDSAMYRNRANLGRKRGHRAPAIRPGGTLGLSEAADSDARLFQDSTGRADVSFDVCVGAWGVPGWGAWGCCVCRPRPGPLQSHERLACRLPTRRWWRSLRTAGHGCPWAPKG